MNTQRQNILENEKRRKEQFISKYLGQKDRLPQTVQDLCDHELKEPIDLYALVDLDDDLKFCEKWFVLTQNKLALITFKNGVYEFEKTCDLTRVAEIRELNSLSCNSFVLIEAHDLPPLMTVRFTQRQKIIMGHMKYIIETRKKEEDTLSHREYDADRAYQESIMKPVIEAQNSMTGENTRTLWRLLSYLLPYKKELAIGATGAVLTTVVSLIPAWLSGHLIDEVVRPFQDGKLDANEASSIAWILVGSLGLTYLLREAFIFLRLNKMSILGEKVAMDLRKKLYTHLQTLSLDFYSKKHTGSIISRVSSDTDRIWDFVAFGVVEVSIAMITLVGLSVVLISMDWRLGVWMSIPVPLLLFSIYRHGEKMKKMFLKAWRKWSDVTAVLSDTIPGMQVVKAFNQEDREVKRFNKKNEVVTTEFNEIHSAWTRFWPLLMMGIHVITIGTWALATPRLISTEGSIGHLKLGTFVSFLLYMTMFAQPIEVIGQVARMLNRALSSAYRIFEILDTKGTIKEISDPVVLKDLKGQVEFKNVFFSYDGVRQILKDLSFNVKPGEMIGLVGSSGGGKSTITKLIARFYDINGGDILIDGHNIRDLELGSYRKQVGMVLQDPYLFHGTIWENIAYGVPGVGKKEVIEAAKVANAHNFIGRLPHGYDTVIGERGHTLSGGERQRVSIARALLANPKILILDEATSAVDTETERNIQEAIDRLIEGRTVFAVAHRLSTLRKANRIFVVGKGGIVEQGSHADLLSKEKGEYKKLHQMQKEMSESFAL